MTRGKPWKANEENALRSLVEAKTPIDVIAVKLGRKPDAVYMKCLRLGLTGKPETSAPSFPLPKELPSIEETLRKLADALDAASTPGLDRAEVQRLHAVAKLAKAYKEILEDFVHYSEIEAKVNEMEAKYEALSLQSAMQSGKDSAAQQVSGSVAES
jgi:hypothetical protein